MTDTNSNSNSDPARPAGDGLEPGELPVDDAANSDHTAEGSASASDDGISTMAGPSAAGEGGPTARGIDLSADDGPEGERED